jgi:hypothetical protein
MTSFESSFFLDTPHVRMHAFDRRPPQASAAANANKVENFAERAAALRKAA